MQKKSYDDVYHNSLHLSQYFISSIQSMYILHARYRKESDPLFSPAVFIISSFVIFELLAAPLVINGAALLVRFFIFLTSPEIFTYYDKNPSH